MNDLSYGVTMWAQVSYVLSQFARLTVRRTDRQTEKPCNTVHCIKCSRTVKWRLCLRAVFTGVKNVKR